MCTKRIRRQVSVEYPRWMLNRHLDQHLIDISINIWSTLNQHLSQQSVESWLIFADTPGSVNHYKWVCWHWQTVEHVSIKCQSSVDSDADGVSV